MSRQEEIINGRIINLNRGLLKAGYLANLELESTKTPESFMKLAVTVLTDILHLGVVEYKVVEVKKTNKTDTRIAVQGLLEKITTKAAENFTAEIASGLMP